MTKRNAERWLKKTNDIAGYCRSSLILRSISISIQYAITYDHPVLWSHYFTELAVSFPSFNGNSYLTHQPIDFSQSTTNRILLSIKTSSPGGTLIYSVSNPLNPFSDFLHLFLEDGFVVYEFACGLGNVFTVRSTLRINTDELMTILVM